MKELSTLIGRIAITDSQMSPKGTVLIDDEVYEAVTDGEYIDPGRGVKITRVIRHLFQGNMVVVKRV